MSIVKGSFEKVAKDVADSKSFLFLISYHPEVGRCIW